MRLFTPRQWILSALVVTAAAAGISLRAERAWQEMLVSGARLERSLEELETTRPVLHGEVLAGLAFDEYTRAAALVRKDASMERLDYLTAREQGDESAAGLRALCLADSAELLSAIALGARRRDARYPIDWEAGLVPPSLLEMRDLVNLTVLAAERELDEGRPQRAVEVLLDGMQRLDEGLGSSSAACDGELAWFIRRASLCSEAGQGGSLPGSALEWSAWRQGFSARWRIAERARRAGRWTEALQASQGLAWSESRERLAPLINGSAVESDPRDLGFARYGLWIEQADRGAIALVRLARAAVEYRRSGRAAALPDPFGDELILSESAEGLRLESRGPGEERDRSRYVLEIQRGSG